MNGSDGTVHFRLDLRYPDGAGRIITIAGDCAGPRVVPPVAELLVAALPDSESEHCKERSIEAVILAIDSWCAQHELALLNDPTNEIFDAFELGGVTEVQREKFRSFAELAIASEVLNLARRVIAADALSIEDRGTNWGVTVCPGPGQGLRINVGPREILTIFLDGRVLIHFVGDESALGSTPRSFRSSEGFRKVENAYRAQVSLGPDTDALLANPVAMAQHRAFVEANYRKLPNPKWHNPLTASLLDSGSGPSGGPGGELQQ